mgnify:CR=1 FL=1
MENPSENKVLARFISPKTGSLTISGPDQIKPSKTNKRNLEGKKKEKERRTSRGLLDEIQLESYFLTFEARIFI